MEEGVREAISNYDDGDTRKSAYVKSQSHPPLKEAYKLNRWATAVTVWGMAISVVSPGNYYGFNGGYAFGSFAGYTIAVVIDTTMFLCLTYTLSELASMMPYAGGSYVWSRNSLGRFMGSLSGALDSIEYICGAGCTTPLIGLAFVTILEVDVNYIIPFALMSHVIIAAIHSIGGRLVWWLTLAFALYIILGIVCFFFGTISIWVWGDNLHYMYPASSSSGAELIDGGLFLDGVHQFFGRLLLVSGVSWELRLYHSSLKNAKSPENLYRER